MKATIETIAAYEGRCAVVSGPIRSGKTEALVARVAELLRRGVAADSIFVEVASAFAAHEFRGRLVRALESSDDAAAAEAAAHVRVARAIDLAVDVLSTPEALEETGRVPRLLTDAEYLFFLEDMKTLGMPVRRLRGMLSLFYRQWSLLAPEESWMGTEEEGVRDALVRILSARKAMLAEEASMQAVRFLESEAGATVCKRFDYVLCDDFQSLSRAEQTCLCLLAGTQLIVAGNPNEAISRPRIAAFPEGLTRFAELRHGVDEFLLEGAHGNPAALALVDALAAHGDMDASLRAGHVEGTGRALRVKWNTPEEELRSLATLVRAWRSEENSPAYRTCILVPNRRWALLAALALTSEGFTCSMAGADASLGGDPREAARAKALVAYTKLALLADSSDLTSWRSWCGFDNHLTNSDAWARLTEFAEDHEIGLLEALEEIAAPISVTDAEKPSEEPFLRANVLARRFAAGTQFIAENAGYRGHALLRAVGAEGLPEFADLEALIEGDEDAARLYAIAREFFFNPTWPRDAHTLHIALPSTLAGTSYDIIIALGCVDGFFPPRDAFEVVSTDEERARVTNEARRSFASAVGKAERLLALSSFSKAGLELAERTKMQVARVTAEKGERVAVLRPSLFFTEAGAACPTTEGGQSLLARLS